MIAIVNSGTQPELRFLARSLQESDVQFKYFTSSSIGSDWFANSIGRYFKSKVWMQSFIGRRKIPISENYISRSLFFLSLIIRVLPPAERMFLFRIRNTIHRLMIFPRIIFGDFDLVVFQDDIPSYWRLYKSKTRFVLLLSNATPHYVLSVMSEQIAVGAFPIKYFGRSLPRRRELAKFEFSCTIADAIVVPSNFVKSSFSALPDHIDRAGIEVLRLGVDETMFNAKGTRKRRKVSGDPIRIIFVGQICGRKGVGFLANAFDTANLPQGSRLTLVGSSVNGFAEFLMAKFKDIDHIGFMNQWELKEFYADMDLFVMPSLIEGFCLSAIEAMSSGIPILVSPETIDNIQTNYLNGLTAPSSNLNSLREQLEWAAQNPLLLNELGINGSILASDYTWGKYGEKFKIYLLGLRNNTST